MLRESIAVGCVVLTLGGSSCHQKVAHVPQTNVHVNQPSKIRPYTDTVRGITTVRHVHAVPLALFTAWSKVNVCEEGGNWNSYGAAFPDALGIRATVWSFFGGRISKTYRPSIRDQILVGNRIIHHFHIHIPDQNGCHGW